MKPIRVLIADDHPIVRQGIRSLLEQFPDMDIVGAAASGPATLQQVAALQPDVVLLDVRLAGSNGIEVARQLRRYHPQSRIVILTTYDDDEYLFGALQVGAQAYLLKDASLDVLPAAIRAVHSGKRLLSPLLVDKVLHQFQSLATSELRRESGLTEEEIRILQLLAEGASNRQIADDLDYSEAAIKKKVQAILEKLQATNRTQAVANAIRRGLI